MSKQPISGTVLKTAEELEDALVLSAEGSLILKDSGGFIWWNEWSDLHQKWVLHGVATPRYTSDSSLGYGLAAFAYLNIFTGTDAVHYGPFTVIHYEPEGRTS